MKTTILTEFQAAWIWHPRSIVHLKPVSVIWYSTASELERDGKKTNWQQGQSLDAAIGAGAGFGTLEKVNGH